MAPSKAKAEVAYKEFIAIYEAKYPKAVCCLTKDKDKLFSFYDFPAEPWGIFALPILLSLSLQPYNIELGKLEAVTLGKRYFALSLKWLCKLRKHG